MHISIRNYVYDSILLIFLYTHCWSLVRTSSFCHILMPYRFQNMCLKCFLHTNIIGHYNPSVRITGLVSHTTYVVCVNFIHKWRDLQFKIDSERKIFWETFLWQFYLLSEFLPEICWEQIAQEILFVFRFDVWPGTLTLAFRLISQHTSY